MLPSSGVNQPAPATRLDEGKNMTEIERLVNRKNQMRWVSGITLRVQCRAILRRKMGYRFVWRNPGGMA